jgi:hypothetical protein
VIAAKVPCSYFCGNIVLNAIKFSVEVVLIVVYVGAAGRQVKEFS